MDIEKLHKAIGTMSEALKETGGASPGKNPMMPPKQPGQVLWDSGYYYMADGFSYEATAPIVKWIMEKK